MTIRQLLILLLLFPGLSSASRVTDGCIKTVFDRYCLGGSLSLLIRHYPPNAQSAANGERRGVIYARGREQIYVMAYQGSIYKVLHTYEPTSQVTFKDLQRRLLEKYGKPQDRSHFPDYVRNLSGKISSIRRGEGEMKYVWQLPGEAWRVELAWMRKPGVSVSFIANELDAKQRDARLEGL
jgi:hypothetical protein